MDLESKISIIFLLWFIKILNSESIFTKKKKKKLFNFQLKGTKKKKKKPLSYWQNLII